MFLSSVLPTASVCIPLSSMRTRSSPSVVVSRSSSANSATTVSRRGRPRSATSTYASRGTRSYVGASGSLSGTSGGSSTLRLGLDRQLALLDECGGLCYLDRFGAGVVVPLDVASIVDQPAAAPWVHPDRIG